jgi:CRISPR-associated protein Cas1
MDRLLGIEGMAARLYFSAFSGMLKSRQEGVGCTFDFNGRNRRPPVDPVNALLSYAYALLAKDLTVTTLAVGFDPFLGFYHQPRYGRPSLALDLMEEFRPIIADSVVLWVVNNGMVSPSDFVRRGPAVALNPDARRKFIQAYEKRLDTLITHPVFGYRISYRRVLEVQVRLLGRVLSGEIAVYPAFKTR